MRISGPPGVRVEPRREPARPAACWGPGRSAGQRSRAERTSVVLARSAPSPLPVRSTPRPVSVRCTLSASRPIGCMLGAQRTTVAGGERGPRAGSAGRRAGAGRTRSGRPGARKARGQGRWQVQARAALAAAAQRSPPRRCVPARPPADAPAHTTGGEGAAVRPRDQERDGPADGGAGAGGPGHHPLGQVRLRPHGTQGCPRARSPHSASRGPLPQTALRGDLGARWLETLQGDASLPTLPGFSLPQSPRPVP